MSSDIDVLLSDDRVRLRAFTPNDVELITAACQDSEIVRWTTIPSPYPVEFAEAFVALTDAWRSDGSALHFAIVDRRDDQLVGSIGLDSIKRPPAQIGYWVARWARRQHLATRALQVLTAWAYERLRLDTITLLINLGNEASERVAANAGYRLINEVHDDRTATSEAEDVVRRWQHDHTQPTP